MAALLTSPLVNVNHFGLRCNGAGTADACTASLLVTRKRQ